MKLLASMAILIGLALPCMASDPTRPRIAKPRPAATSWARDWMNNQAPQPPRPWKLTDDLVRTILLPERSLIQWGFDQVGSRRFRGNVIGLQVPRQLPRGLD